MKTTHAAPLLLGAALAAGPAAAGPQDVYAKVSASVWKVVTYDTDGLPLGQGSAVVIAPETLITNCHVLARAKRVAVRREKTTIDAKLELWDVQRDVCQLKAAGLTAPVVKLGDATKVQVGQNAYAIGNPRGLDLTMSAGLVSQIRRDGEGRIVLIQTTAAISGGSSGGGLFDDSGLLVGLTTLASVTGDAQNLNFAVPVEWIKELPQRHAKAAKPAAAASASAAATPTSATPATSTPTTATSTDGTSSTAATSAAIPAAAPPCVGANGLPPPANDPAVTDVSRLPWASAKMREQYQAFLNCPLPRAFAISEGGRWWYAWSTKPADRAAPVNPSDRALWACEKTNSGRCFLYAVDNRVVYDPAGK